MEEIKILSMEPKDGSKKVQSKEFFRDVIKGAVAFNHVIKAGASLELKVCDYYHILVVFSGKAKAITGGKTYEFNERLTFSPDPNEDLVIEAVTDTRIFEVQQKKKKDDEKLIKDWKVQFPYMLTYAESVQYRDKNKSETTISRIMCEQRHIPRFAMGSVDAIGQDYVKSHAHPTLDQFFVSFPENDMFVILDYEPYRMKGNEILHIPLGGDHGVCVTEKKRLHYIWVDFLVEESAYERLDKGHVPTGKWTSVEELTANRK
jgi:quercetin dioxygenase-like cupin family protein